jgi:hypothetical protein
MRRAVAVAKRLRRAQVRAANNERVEDAANRRDDTLARARRIKAANPDITTDSALANAVYKEMVDEVRAVDPHISRADLAKELAGYSVRSIRRHLTNN